MKKYTKKEKSEQGLKYRRTPSGVLQKIYSKQKQRSIKYGWKLYYSFEYLKDKFLNNKKFIRIFNNWIKSGYNKWEKPSVDRINCYKPYTKDNIQLMTWKENFRKGNRENTLKRGKNIIMCDMDGTELKIFEGLREAAKEMNLHHSNISLVCSGKAIHTGGYRWKFKIK